LEMWVQFSADMTKMFHLYWNLKYIQANLQFRGTSLRYKTEIQAIN